MEDKTIVLKQCATEKVVADSLTKGLPAPAFERHKAEMLGKLSNACSACVVFTGTSVKSDRFRMS